MTSTWSDSPLSVFRSYYMPSVHVLDMIRSIQDRSFPLLYVQHAGGPGYRPLSMCQPYSSHNSISHGAREFFFWSSLCLGMVVSSISGNKFPILVFQSPHTTVVTLFWKHSITSSIMLHATSSSILRFYKLCIGGK